MPHPVAAVDRLDHDLWLAANPRKFGMLCIGCLENGCNADSPRTTSCRGLWPTSTPAGSGHGSAPCHPASSTASTGVMSPAHELRRKPRSSRTRRRARRPPACAAPAATPTVTKPSSRGTPWVAGNSHCVSPQPVLRRANPDRQLPTTADTVSAGQRQGHPEGRIRAPLKTGHGTRHQSRRVRGVMHGQPPQLPPERAHVAARSRQT